MLCAHRKYEMSFGNVFNTHNGTKIFSILYMTYRSLNQQQAMSQHLRPFLLDNWG